jgi:hypothetical protein
MSRPPHPAYPSPAPPHQQRRRLRHTLLLLGTFLLTNPLRPRRGEQLGIGLEVVENARVVKRAGLLVRSASVASPLSQWDIPSQCAGLGRLHPGATWWNRSLRYAMLEGGYSIGS